MVCLISFGQSENEETVYELDKVTDIAEYVDGGEDGLLQFIISNLKYPNVAAENGTQGVVVIVFTVNTDGSVSNIEPVGKEKLGNGLEEEAIRVVKLTDGKWIPAKKDGKPVAVKYRLPLRFALK